MIHLSSSLPSDRNKAGGEGNDNGKTNKGKGKQPCATTRHSVAAGSQHRDACDDAIDEHTAEDLGRGDVTTPSEEEQQQQQYEDDEDSLIPSLTAKSAEREAFSLDDLRALFRCGEGRSSGATGRN